MRNVNRDPRRAAWRGLAAVLLILIAAAGPRAAEPARGLDIYFVDTEGGAATLIVTPRGESVLIDCGNPGTRDARRIHRVATEQAKLGSIDHLVLTHWHTDHFGGVAELARLLPIRRYYDRGVPEAPAGDLRGAGPLLAAYKAATGGKSRALAPGDEVALRQSAGGPALRLGCLVGSGQVLPDKPGAPENPVAKEHRPKPEDPSDNAKSLGFLLRYGDFRFLDLGDLTWNVEHKLVHPSDKIGLIDVYQVTHHGLPSSNNPVLIRTVQPRVAVFSNGARKGGHPEVTAALRAVPGIRAIYQLHRNVTAGPEDNAKPEFIANADEACRGEFIKLSVAPDGRSYTVTVGGSGAPRRYETRRTAR